MIDWVLKLVFLTAICFITIFLVRYNLALTIETQDARALIFLERVLSSPTGIAYTDPLTGRTYPFIIDSAKLNTAQQALENSIKLSKNDYIAAELNLVFGNGNIQKISYNTQGYEQWKKGIIQGNHISIPFSTKVLVAKENAFVPGKLTADIITPKG